MAFDSVSKRRHFGSGPRRHTIGPFQPYNHRHASGVSGGRGVRRLNGHSSWKRDCGFTFSAFRLVRYRSHSVRKLRPQFSQYGSLCSHVVEVSCSCVFEWSHSAQQRG